MSEETNLTVVQYVGKHASCADWTLERKNNATKLVAKVNELKALAESDGVKFHTNDATKSIVSGQEYGGFRPQSCTIGAAHSAHKEGLAVDLYDPFGAIDEWCMRNLEKLKQIGIYMEHPSATEGWSHWSIKPPASGRTVFFP